MSGLFHLELLLYCLSFKDERAIPGQLPKVLLPMIGVLFFHVVYKCVTSLIQKGILHTVFVVFIHAL